MMIIKHRFSVILIRLRKLLIELLKVNEDVDIFHHNENIKNGKINESNNSNKKKYSLL